MKIINKVLERFVTMGTIYGDEATMVNSIIEVFEPHFKALYKPGSSPCPVISEQDEL